MMKEQSPPRSRLHGLVSRLGQALNELRGIRPEISIDSLQLEIGASHDGQTLQIRYGLTNNAAVDVFVQHYVKSHPEKVPSCYIYHVHPNQVVLWAGTPPCVPKPHHGPAPDFALPPVPWAERLLPGESLDVLLRLPLPLVEFDLYYQGEGPPAPVWANVIRFRVDVQPKRRGLYIREHQGDYWVSDTPMVLEASTTVDPPIPVHSYGELFHRAGLED